MEQVQEDMAEMREQLTAQINGQMTRFLEVITNVTRGQEELRALVEIPREEQGQHELQFEDISVGQPCQIIVMNPFVANNHDPRTMLTNILFHHHLLLNNHTSSWGMLNRML